MNSTTNVGRLIGAAFLVVFATSLVSERLLTAAVGTGSMSDRLVSIARNLTRMRISNLVAVVDSLVIIVLAALQYSVFSSQSKTLALVALVLGCASALILAVSKLGAYGLIPLSREFVEAGASDASPFQPLAEFLYRGIDRMGYNIHNAFYALAAVLWYTLLHSSRYVPRGLSLWGLVAACLLAILSLLTTYNPDFDHPIVMAVTGLPYLPFEPVLGLWLLIMGFR